ncbi:MAG: G/U mismatch-specific DNA glycosylase [Chloroflexota bacterium]
MTAARNETSPDIGGPGLAVLFAGINPSLYSAAVGHHFGRPGNRFWKVLHLAGFTPRLLTAFEDGELFMWRIGITNMVARASVAAAELSAGELREGGAALERLVQRWRPALVAFVGVQAYRIAYRQPAAVVGRQVNGLGNAGVWVLPNTSGLQAHYQLADLVRLYTELHQAAFGATEAYGGSA